METSSCPQMNELSVQTKKSSSISCFNRSATMNPVPPKTLGKEEQLSGLLPLDLIRKV